MFGYVKPRHSDLLVKEYDFYRAAYCGVCHAMRKHTGFFTSFALSYDMVLLALVRMLATQRTVCAKRCRCIAHPCRKRYTLCENEALVYAARASAILLYEKCQDDKKDKGKSRLRAHLISPIFRRGAKRAGLRFLCEETQKCLAELSLLEKEKTPSIDAPAAVFGDLLGLIFAEGLTDTLYQTFYNVGYHLGVFIYAADAADDYRADKKSGNYNPYVLLYPDDEGFLTGIPEQVTVSLRLTLEKLAEAVEKLPFGEDKAVENIIKNTVYLGLPDRIAQLGRPKPKRKEQKAKHDLIGGDYDRSL